MDKLKIKEFISNKNNIILYMLLAVGIGVMLVGGSADKKSDAVQTESETSMEELRASEEERLCKILSNIKGAGEVSVMISYYESAQKDLAYETKESEDIRGESGAREKTLDKQAVMADGEPVVIKQTYPRVRGVVVASSGAGDSRVKEALSQAVQAVTDVPAHRVCVYEME